MAGILTLLAKTVLSVAAFSLPLQAQDQSSLPRIADSSSGVEAQLHGLMDKAVALGFPDARGAALYVGEIRVRCHGQHGDQEYCYSGAHAHLRDGRWLIQLAYPLPVDHDSTEVDKSQTLLVTDTTRDIIHPRNMSIWEEVDPRITLPYGHGEDGLGAAGAACATLIAAGIHQKDDIPGVLSSFSPDFDGLIIGPSRLRLCLQRNSQSWVVRAHDYPTSFHHLEDDRIPAQTVLAYALSAWFVSNIHGLPPPFSSLAADAAKSGAIAMLPSDDTATRSEVRLANEPRPMGSSGSDALAVRLATWRIEKPDEGQEIFFNQLANSERFQHDPHAFAANSSFSSFMDSRFTSIDLPGLFALVGDRRPSGWIDLGHFRTIGDQALRAIASVLGFDPRILARRSVDVAWDDDERRTVASGLARWWTDHAQESLAQIRREALPLMNWRQIGFLLHILPPHDAAPLFDLLAQQWKEGPPEGFDDIDLLELGQNFPGFTRISTAWPVTGAGGPLLAFWLTSRGHKVDLDACMDSALDAQELPFRPRPRDVVYAMTYRLDTGILRHLHGLLARDPMTAQGEALIRCCLDNNPFYTTVESMWDRAQIDAHRTRAFDAVRLSMLMQLLHDERPISAGIRSWAESLIYNPIIYYPLRRIYLPEEPLTTRKIAKDARIADCAAMQAYAFRYPIASVQLEKRDRSLKPPWVFAFDPDAPLAERDASLARIRDYVDGVQRELLEECKITSAGGTGDF